MRQFPFNTLRALVPGLALCHSLFQGWFWMRSWSFYWGGPSITCWLCMSIWPSLLPLILVWERIYRRPRAKQNELVISLRILVQNLSHLSKVKGKFSKKLWRHMLVIKLLQATGSTTRLVISVWAVLWVKRRMQGILTTWVILFMECHAFESTDGMFYEEKTVPVGKWSLLQEYSPGILATKSLCGLLCNSKNCLAFRINLERNSCQFGVVDPTLRLTPGDDTGAKIKVFYDPSQRGTHKPLGSHWTISEWYTVLFNELFFQYLILVWFMEAKIQALQRF